MASQNGSGTNLGPLVTAAAAVGGPSALVNFVVPPDGATFSHEALTIITFLLSALVTAILSLFWLLMKEKDERIREWKQLTYRGTDIAERAISRVAETTADH